MKKRQTDRQTGAEGGTQRQRVQLSCLLLPALFPFFPNFFQLAIPHIFHREHVDVGILVDAFLYLQQTNSHLSSNLLVKPPLK